MTDLDEQAIEAAAKAMCNANAGFDSYDDYTTETLRATLCERARVIVAAYLSAQEPPADLAVQKVIAMSRVDLIERAPWGRGWDECLKARRKAAIAEQQEHPGDGMVRSIEPVEAEAILAAFSGARYWTVGVEGNRPWVSGAPFESGEGMSPRVRVIEAYPLLHALTIARAKRRTAHGSSTPEQQEHSAEPDGREATSADDLEEAVG